MLNYEEDIKIDESALDIEWLDQASLSLKYGRHLSNLKSIQRRLEEKKKTTRSELVLKVNKNAETLIGKKSPNAGDIEAFYRNDPGYKAIIEELNNAIEEAEYAEIAYQQISWTRKAALENLVKLNGQQYFAGPSMPRNLTKEVENRREFNGLMPVWQKHCSERRNKMIEILIITILLILSPFVVYIFSKLQMLGWIAGIKSHLIEEEKEKQNGQKTEGK